jgi:hypothetical protein
MGNYKNLTKYFLSSFAFLTLSNAMNESIANLCQVYGKVLCFALNSRRGDLTLAHKFLSLFSDF